MVTVNHRVGVDGYAELGGAPPNRALLDQMAALRWVQDEIRAFGGDPARVTVFGESGGAGAIAALMVMPWLKISSARRSCTAGFSMTFVGQVVISDDGSTRFKTVNS